MTSAERIPYEDPNQPVIPGLEAPHLELIQGGTEIPAEQALEQPTATTTGVEAGFAVSDESQVKRPGQVGGVKVKNRLLTQPEATDADDTSVAPIVRNELRGAEKRHGKKAPLEATAEGTVELRGRKDRKSEAAGASQEKQDFSDIVKIDQTGRGHRPDGKFLTKHELETIENFADEIREGVTSRADKLAELEARRAKLVGVMGYSNYRKRYAGNAEVDPEAWLEREYGVDPNATYAEKEVKMPEDVTEDFWNSLPDITKKQWAGMSEEDKQQVREYLALQSDEAQTLPVTSTSRESLKQRFNKLRAFGRTKLTLMYEDLKDFAGNPKEFYQARETRRRRVVGTVIGAGALIGAGVGIYLATKGGSHHTPGGNRSVGNHGAPGAQHNATPDVQPQVHTETLHAGHTIWGDLREYAEKHGVNANDKELRRAARQVLRENGLSWRQARHLPVGTHLSINQNIYDQLLKRGR